MNKDDERILKVDSNYLQKFYSIFKEIGENIPESFKTSLNGLDKSNEEGLRELLESYRYLQLDAKLMREYLILDEIDKQITLSKDNLNFIYQMIDEHEKDEDVVDIITENNMLIDNVHSKIDDLKIENNDDISKASTGINAIIYPNYIDDVKDRTLNAKSGGEEKCINSVKNLLNNLINGEYQELRKKGLIHHVQNQNKKDGYYIDGCAVERYGGGTTKVEFLRLRVSEKHKEYIKKKFNNDKLEYIILVLDFGDFKNEGKSEKNFYRDNFFRIQSYEKEIMDIMSIFSGEASLEKINKVDEYILNGEKFTYDLDSNKKY